jgi:predicted metal-dependent phosphoesterase TrpH
MNENVNEDDDLEAEEARLLDEYTILLAAYEMSGARDKYEAEQAEEEFLEEFGVLCHEELLDVIRENRKDWKRLRADLQNAKISIKAKEHLIQKIYEKHDRDKKSRIEGNEKKRKEEASKKEKSLAFGVPDFYALVCEVLIRFDNLNKEAGISQKDEVKKIRKIFIDLIISEQRSTANLSREVLERNAKTYLQSGEVRTAREQLNRHQNPKK